MVVLAIIIMLFVFLMVCNVVYFITEIVTLIREHREFKKWLDDFYKDLPYSKGCGDD